MYGSNTHKTNMFAPEINDILNSAFREIMSLTHAECGSLFLFDSEHKELVMQAFYNSHQLDIKGLKYKIGEGISGKVADSKLPILVKDISVDFRFKPNGYGHYRTKSFISIPLIDGGDLWGLINLADKSTGEPFSQDDLHVSIAIAKYAYTAVDSLSNYMKLQQEKEKLEKQKSLLQKYASVGKLAAGIVHEVNNPLDGIIRYTNMLLNQIDNNPIAREYLLEVKKGLDRIATITKSLLEFSHRVNSISSHAKKYLDIHTLIDETLDALGNESSSSIQVFKKYKKNLPEILDLGLPHIVINLIKNALDAMHEGGTLDITTDMDDSALTISFKDTGPGVNDDIKGHIFEPFFTTKVMGKGSGLGLTICNEIIKKYDGKIEMQSSPGEGSVFSISIPKKHIKNAQ